jgi:primosomal protein N''
MTMDRTVREHIRTLEDRLQTLNAQLMQEARVVKRNRLETELRAVESALNLYRSALEIENRIISQNG